MSRFSILLSARNRVLIGIAVIAALCAIQLQLDLRDLWPSQAGWAKAIDFFSAAFSPAWDYEDTPPPGTDPLLTKVAKSLWLTVAFAAAAVSLAFVCGLALGFVASSAWWEQEQIGRSRVANKFAYKLISLKIFWAARLIIFWTTRLFIVVTRSIHELLWAVLFLCAFGLNGFTPVLAIAIPYSGVFAKVFSEVIDESPRDAAYALRSLGASSLHVFFIGLFPRAFPDIVTYGCYRFECGMRSSAVMGFFGIPTIGYYLKPAFDESHYHEVWTYLYGMLLLVVAVDWWSGTIRRQLQSASS